MNRNKFVKPGHNLTKMAPPKKDAFADIFQSATASSSNGSVDKKRNMADLQQKQSVNLSLNNLSKPLAAQNSSQNWDEFDIFTSPSPAASRSPAMATKNESNNDPFDIFTKPQSQPAQPKPTQPSQPKPTQPISGNGISLLDDDFTDVFPEEAQPQPPQKPANTRLYSYQDSSEDEDFAYSEAPSNGRHTSNSNSSRSNGSRSNTSSSKGGKRDEVVAQLLEIGFPTDVSNNAIDEVGLDLQACVNFIMSGGKLKPPSKQQSQRSRTQSPQVEDIGARLNDLSTDFFNKASVFFNKSRDTVVKNIDKFQQAQNGRGSPNDSVPAWMVNQSEYKKNATERKANGDKYEDYGSDEDNIDQDAIREFMLLQKQKDREKNKARLESFTSKARDKINGSRSVSPEKLNAMRPQLQPVRENISRVNTQPSRNSASPLPTASKTQNRAPSPEPEVDLLGLGGGSSMSRAQKFKSGKAEDEVYVSSRRRRGPTKTLASTTPKVPRKTTREPLDQFLQSDYDIGKETASKSFTNGNYDDACINYTKCLNALPQTHELRIIINSNLALTLNKLGNYKLAKDHCNQGLDLISREEIGDTDYIINEKPIKFWYTKLLSRKAEALEMIESFPESLECYMELVSKLGMNDKKTMDAKRRVNNIVNPPPKPKQQPKPKPVSRNKPLNNENLKRVQDNNKKQQDRENLKYQLHDKVQSRIFAWSNGKEDNLRSLLIALPEVLPSHLGFPFLTSKKITINDLMLPKKVKINYMKVISSIHPDKLGSLHLEAEDEMLCQSVFITLNKSWDIFKEQNGIN